MPENEPNWATINVVVTVIGICRIGIIDPPELITKAEPVVRLAPLCTDNGPSTEMVPFTLTMAVDATWTLASVSEPLTSSVPLTNGAVKDASPTMETVVPAAIEAVTTVTGHDEGRRTKMWPIQKPEFEWASPLAAKGPGLATRYASMLLLKDDISVHVELAKQVPKHSTCTWIAELGHKTVAG